MSGQQLDPNNHPVWSVYDEWRTTRLNVKYLQIELKRLRFWARTSELLIAVATTSSVGSFWFFQNTVGALFWKTAGAAAVILSIVRPILKLEDHIQAKEKLLARYSVLDHDLQCISIEIKHRQKYDNIVYKDFVKALNCKAELIKLNLHGQIKPSLRKKCEQMVLEELPPVSFYIPEP